MTKRSHPRTSVTKLIERSSLGSPQARAVRQTVPSSLAAKLVSRSVDRGTKRDQSGKKGHS
jgi:hypothetical protein